MALLVLANHLERMSGKVGKNSLNYYTYRNSKQFMYRGNPLAGTYPPTEAQLTIQAKFKQVTALVLNDLADPQKKKEWEEKARASNGRYTTARGAAFAHYWDAEETI